MSTRAAPRHIRFGREVLGELDACERREWWLANGRGAYAAGTVAGTLTRRYHGLLVAPVNPPLGRFLVLAKADATLHDGNDEWPLYSNRWANDVVHPRGHLLAESFQLDGRMPVWRYAFGDIVIEHRIWMEPGADTTYSAWKLESPLGVRDEPLRLSVKLLVNARDHHGSMHAGGFQPAVESHGTRIVVSMPGWFTLGLQARGGAIEPVKYWVENFDLPVERERGLPDRDNHLCVGHATLELRAGEWVGIVGSLDPKASPYIEEAMRRFIANDESLLQRARSLTPELVDAPDWVHQLVLAADNFVFARPLADHPNGESVIAGYPWFGDWGRDTMIALSGLTLPTGRYESARRILQTFARFVDQGMLPNWFPGTGEQAEYNTADAALWFIEAWRAYVSATDDWVAVREVYPVLAGIVDAYANGTRFGIGVDERDGLLRAGVAGVQVTWMDAKIGDWVVTPRIGKAVELNALWYNAVNSVSWFAERIGHPHEQYLNIAARLRAGFARFINPENGGLFDVLDGPNGNDPTVRPNQIFAVSLPFSPLEPAVQSTVVRQCGRELLGSFGLRSLSPQHPDYRGRYRGGPTERDSSYHQGPIWAWLLGHYALAEYRVTGDAAAAQRRLAPIGDHLLDAGLGTVSEIMEGAPPHQPRGAPAQAWSVACTLEAWWRLERARLKAEASARPAVTA
ncbi:MAG: amylo-alpha-1,6-glucosidase [Burkholderiales bacterium]